MGYRLIKPIGYFPPLIWKKGLTKKSINGLSLRLLTLSNLLLRSLIYPFSFLVSNLITLGSIVAATLFNLGWFLGGAFSNFWSRATKALNQTAITRAQWLLFDSLGFLWNQAKLIVGLIFSSIAVATLNKLKQFAEPLAKISMIHWGWQEPHQKRMKGLAESFDSRGFHTLKMFVCTLAAEPVDSILFGLNVVRGIGKLRTYGLNPNRLTPAQAGQPALLCLHGNFHNQSAWLPLAGYLYQKSYPGPIFTLNLPNGRVTQKDADLINEKIESIKARYRELNGNDHSLKINLIGHSRGSLIAYYSGFSRWELKEGYFHYILRENPLINKTIMIGYSAEELPECRKAKPPVYINGRHDALLFFKNPPKEVDGHLLNTGHLGLLSHPDALERCYSTLVGP